MTKNSSWPVTGLGNKGPLKILNGTKLILHDHGNNLDSFRINLESFRYFRGTLLHKPVTGQELFYAPSYNKPALVPSLKLFNLNFGKVKKWMAVILHIFYEHVTFFILIASLAEMDMNFSFEFKMSLILLCITSVLHFEPNDKVYLGSSSHVLLWSEFKSYIFKAENANFDHLWCMFESWKFVWIW